MTAVSSHVLAKIKEDNRKMRHSSSDQSFQSAKEDHVEEILEASIAERREKQISSARLEHLLFCLWSLATQTLSKELKSKKHSRAPPFHLHPSPDRQMSVLAKNKIECRSSNHNRMVMGDRKEDGPPLGLILLCRVMLKRLAFGWCVFSRFCSHFAWISNGQNISSWAPGFALHAADHI
uniref:Uncharacterized protein n=1 Tax=Ditylenchus dipsaci TaxID=166011 RepID=A0A915DE12_9BILA